MEQTEAIPTGVPTFRWASERILKADLLNALGYGAGVALYTGDGRLSPPSPNCPIAASALSHYWRSNGAAVWCYRCPNISAESICTCSPSAITLLTCGALGIDELMLNPTAHPKECPGCRDCPQNTRRCHRRNDGGDRILPPSSSWLP